MFLLASSASSQERCDDAMMHTDCNDTQLKNFLVLVVNES